jgi:hypothetical protein
MRRIVLMCIALVLGCTLGAQNWHSVSFSFSGPPSGMFYSSGSDYDYQSYTLKNLYEKQVIMDVEEGPNIMIGYSYAATSMLYVGVDAGLNIRTGRVQAPLAFPEEGVDEYLTLYDMAVLPNVVFRWLELGNFYMYSGASAGVKLISRYDASPAVAAAWQVMPLGFLLGKRGFHFFGEAGFGNVYTARIGVSFDL